MCLRKGQSICIRNNCNAWFRCSRSIQGLAPSSPPKCIIVAPCLGHLPSCYHRPHPPEQPLHHLAPPRRRPTHVAHHVASTRPLRRPGRQPSPGARQLAALHSALPTNLRQQHQLITPPMAGRRRAQEDDGLHPPGGYGEGQ
jgi:hypothetical protein